jgi:isocitrate dehydrogenase kinase/phosphatase
MKRILYSSTRNYQNIHCNFLDYIITSKLAKYILITNCFKQISNDQDVEKIGETRELDAFMYPLKRYNPIVLKEYKGKQVCLVQVQP